ncbi:MAG: hypothetical protein WC184_07720 [Acidimicrobiia bacterium]
MTKTFPADTNVLIALIVREHGHFELNGDSPCIHLITMTDLSLEPLLLPFGKT